MRRRRIYINARAAATDLTVSSYDLSHFTADYLDNWWPVPNQASTCPQILETASTEIHSLQDSSTTLVTYLLSSKLPGLQSTFSMTSYPPTDDSASGLDRSSHRSDSSSVNIPILAAPSEEAKNKSHDVVGHPQGRPNDMSAQPASRIASPEVRVCAP